MDNPPTLSEEEINRITLQYFTNPSYYDDVQPDNAVVEAARRKDVKFYRRRIVAMTKELFRQGTSCKSLQLAFDCYVNSAVAHLKMLDTKDILQKEYQGLEASQPSAICPQEASLKLEEANSRIMKAQQIGGTLDSFVTSTKTVESEEVPPKLKTINLHDPQLKTKGVKRKKKR